LKQNILIWFIYYRNESKTFWFGPKKFFSQAVRLSLGPKILGRSKAIWYGLEIIFCNVERFYLIQKLMDRSKTLWFGPLIIATRAKRFDLVRLLLERKQNNFIWSENYRKKERKNMYLSCKRNSILLNVSYTVSEGFYIFDPKTLKRRVTQGNLVDSPIRIVVF
jgi:hypothetical protein